jgi:hypothetical protein
LIVGWRESESKVGRFEVRGSRALRAVLDALARVRGKSGLMLCGGGRRCDGVDGESRRHCRHVVGRGLRCVARGRWKRVRGVAHGRSGDDALIVGSGPEAGIEEDGGIVRIVDLAGEAGRGDVDADGVEQVGGGGEFTDDVFRLGQGLQAFAIEAGEFEAEEESVGPLAVNEVAGEGVDDLRERKLDG